MKIYTVFKNMGEVDVNAFRLLGASSKENDDTKIGFWGSGLKYAIAVLLRNNIDIKAFTGTKEVKIAKRKTKMRDEEYDVITINGTPTSITTRAGKDWQLWFAIRELYANGLDEQGFEMAVEDRPQGEKDKTKICIEMTDEIKDIFSKFDRYFSKNRSVFTLLGNDRIYERLDAEHSVVYRRGIRVWTGKQKMLFDYDFHHIQINESRVVVSQFELDWNLTGLWKEKANEEMIFRLINNKDCYELALDFNYGLFNPVWKNVLKDYTIIPLEVSGFYVEKMAKKHIILPNALCKELSKQFGNALDICGMTSTGRTYRELPITEDMKTMIEQSKPVLDKLGADVSKYKIIVANIHDEMILGQTDEGTIILSEQVFSTPKLLISTLLEEFIHLEYGYEDNSRRMQNFLFKTIVDLIY